MPVMPLFFKSNSLFQHNIRIHFAVLFSKTRFAFLKKYLIILSFILSKILLFCLALPPDYVPFYNSVYREIFSFTSFILKFWLFHDSVPQIFLHKKLFILSKCLVLFGECLSRLDIKLLSNASYEPLQFIKIV